MWAFLFAQLLKNWSISFFEKVTLLNLMPSASPNGGGIPRWFPLFPTSPKVHRGLGQSWVRAGLEFPRSPFRVCGPSNRCTFLEKVIS